MDVPLKEIIAKLFAGTPASEGPWKERFWVYGILLLLSFVTYANTLPNEFVFDDKPVIVRNPLIQDLRSIPTVFTTPRWIDGETHLYRPVTLTSYALNHALGGLDPRGYHLLNIAVHGLVVICLYALGSRLGLSRTANFLSAALFAVHPIHTEAVAPIVGRAELLMSLGTFLALIGYIDSWRYSAGRLYCLLASTAIFGLALLSKEQAMVLPFLLILYDLSSPRYPVTSVRKKWRECLLRYMGYFATLGIVLGIRHSLLGSALYTSRGQIAFLDNPLAHLDWASRLPGALAVGGRYLGLFLWPEHLANDYSYHAIALPSSFWAPSPMVTLLVIGTLIYLAGWSYLRGQRRAFFAIGFTLATFAPASNILLPIGTIMGERLFYLPSAGLCLLIAIAFDWLIDRYHFVAKRRMATFSILVILVVLGLAIARTMYRNRDWQNGSSLGISTLATVPNNAKVHMGIGGVHIQNRDFAAALEAYKTAIRIYPDYPLHYPRFAKNLGSIYLGLGNLAEGILHLKTAVRLRPDYASAHYNLGYAYLGTRDWAKAAEHFGISLEFEPSRDDAKKGLALAEAHLEQATGNGQ